MEGRSGPLGVAALVSILLPGVYFLGGSGSQRRSAAVSDTTGAASAASMVGLPRTAIQLIGDFVGVPVDSLQPSRKPVVRAMIVELPDPIDSPHLDWAYDAGITSIRRAAELTKFVTDRFWLPWMTDGTPAARMVGRGDLRRTNPGVLLFRSLKRSTDNQPSDRDTLQIVFVVGETPTAGLHKAAFLSAVRQIDGLYASGLLALDDTATLRIVGPYFTGAATSLRLALQARKLAPRIQHVALVTGSATQEAIRTELTGVPGLEFDATVNSDVDLLHVLIGAICGRLGYKPSEVVLLKESSTAYGQGAQEENRPALGARGRLALPETLQRTQALVDSFTVVPFPMNIASLRNEEDAWASTESGASIGPRRTPFSISLREPGTGFERPPSVSALTPASVSLAVDEIGRAIAAHHVRAVGIIATDVRDKLFLAREVRRRLPDVQLFTTESNLLYLWPEYNDALRGMLVATTYPLLLETQTWNASESSAKLMTFTEEAAEGVFNAVLLQMRAEPESLRDYAVPGLTNASRRPPIWLLAVGRRMFVPLSVDTTHTRSQAYVHAAPLPLKVRQMGAPATGGGAIAAWHDMSRGERWRALGMSLVVFSVIIGLLYRFIESHRNKDEYRRIDRREGSDKATFTELRSLIFARSLLLHQQLYTMIRDLAVGIGVVLVAIMLLTHDSDAHGGAGATLAPEMGALPIVLVTIVIGVVAYSAVWIGRVIWRTREQAWEYAVMRDWGTERRRQPRVPGDAAADAAGVALRRRRISLEPGPTWRHFLWIVEIIVRSMVVVVAAFFAVLVIALVIGARAPAQPAFHGLTSVLFFHRAMQLTSGLSPAVPVLLGAFGFAAWSTWHLSRVHLLMRPVAFELLADAPVSEGLIGRLQARLKQIRDHLFFVVPDGLGLTLLAVLLLFGLGLSLQFDASLEALALRRVLGILPNPFDLILVFCVLAALGSITWGLYRFWTVWSELKGFLDDIAASAFLSAFERIPKRVSHLSQLSLRQGITREALEQVAAMQWGHLVAIRAAAPQAFDALPVGMREPIGAVIKHSRARSEGGPFDVGADQPPECAPRRACERATVERLRLLFRALEQCWAHEPQSQQLDSAIASITASAKDGALGSTSGRLRRLVTDPTRLWLRAAEETGAVQVVAYIEWVLQHLRVLAFFLLVGILIATSLLSSYPFQPQSAVKLIFVALLTATVGSILFVGTQMNRDDVISRITRTDPGRVTWSAGYIINILVFGLLPILAYVGSDVRPIRDGVLSWLEPLARMVSQH